MAYQRGPVWWASKHRRHHKFCDKPEDPHSWTQTNFLYAWIGWTSFESHTDDEFVTKLMTYPEMLVLDWLWMFPMMLTHLAIYKALGPQWMICLATMPMLISNLVTLLFIIFDLEVTFLFPWAITFGNLGLLGFLSMMFFLIILTIGFIYEWKKGALEWQ